MYFIAEAPLGAAGL